MNVGDRVEVCDRPVFRAGICGLAKRFPWFAAPVQAWRKNTMPEPTQTNGLPEVCDVQAHGHRPINHLNARPDALGDCETEMKKTNTQIRHWQKGSRRVGHCGATDGSIRDVSAKAFHDSRKAPFCSVCARLAREAVAAQIVEEWRADRLKEITPPRPFR